MRRPAFVTVFLTLLASSALLAAGGDTGVAGYYSDKLEGHTMANGEPVDQAAMTAAVAGHPFGSKLRVTNTKSGDSAIVRVTDRLGPNPGAIVIVTRAAAKALGFAGSGTARVRVELVERSAAQTARVQSYSYRQRLERRRELGGLAPSGMKPSPFAYSKRYARPFAKSSTSQAAFSSK